MQRLCAPVDRPGESQEATEKKSEPLFKHSKAELERDVTMLNLSRSCKETTLR